MPDQQETPIRVKILDRRAFYDAEHIRKSNADLFVELGVPKRTGYRILASKRERRLQHSNEADRRGKRSQMTPRALQHLEMLITRHGIDGRLLTWQDLHEELLNIGISLTIRSIQMWLGSMDFRRCVACSRRKSSFT